MDACCAGGNCNVCAVVHDDWNADGANELSCENYEIACGNVLETELNAGRAAAHYLRRALDQSRLTVADVICNSDEPKNRWIDHFLTALTACSCSASVFLNSW